jgi:hypothetical protein
VKNPQIINGGQTAYTLSTIYDDTLRGELADEVFDSKEVLLRVITFVDADDAVQESRLQLIEEISRATNQQTAVVEADRRSNDQIQIDLQDMFFREFGYLYERKKGEFWDGLREGYIGSNRVIDRADLLRVCTAIEGRPDRARGRSEGLLFREQDFNWALHDASKYKEVFFSYLCFARLEELERECRQDRSDRYGVARFGNALRYGKFAVVSVAHRQLTEEVTPSNVHRLAENTVADVLGKWLPFEEYIKHQPGNEKFFQRSIDPETGEATLEANFPNYYRVSNLLRDLTDYFGP